MLRIYGSQMAALDLAREDDLIAELEELLRSTVSSRMPPGSAEARERIREGLERARAQGVRGFRALFEYVALTFILGIDFSAREDAIRLQQELPPDEWPAQLLMLLASGGAEDRRPDGPHHGS